MRQPPISAVIITKNEVDNIARCIQSVQQVASEVVIVDANSIDDTTGIAERMGAKVFQKKWVGYGWNKNCGNQLAKYPWILSIDADEVLSPELITSIQALSLSIDSVYSINRIVNYEGQWVKHSGWHPDWKVRLFHRSNAHWDETALVHETLVFPSNTIQVSLAGLLHHYSYKNTRDHWQRIEQYAQLAAQQLALEGKKATFLKLYLAPIIRFLKTYFLKKGFLDGRLGWIISWRNAYLVYRKYSLINKRRLNKRL